MIGDGVALNSAAHPRGSWWHSLLCRFWGLRASSLETVEMELPPFLDERRVIDGVEHVWLGGGWMAVPYAKNISWAIQEGDGKPNPAKGGTLAIKPLGLRIEDTTLA
jgi:hypothetical protein